MKSPSFNFYPCCSQEIVFKIQHLFEIWMHLHMVASWNFRAALKTRVLHYSCKYLQYWTQTECSDVKVKLVNYSPEGRQEDCCKLLKSSSEELSIELLGVLYLKGERIKIILAIYSQRHGVLLAIKGVMFSGCHLCSVVHSDGNWCFSCTFLPLFPQQNGGVHIRNWGCVEFNK